MSENKVLPMEELKSPVVIWEGENTVDAVFHPSASCRYRLG